MLYVLSIYLETIMINLIHLGELWHQFMFMGTCVMHIYILVFFGHFHASEHINKIFSDRGTILIFAKRKIRTSRKQLDVDIKKFGI